MPDLFDILVESLVAVEGDYSDDPADPGGKTKWGVTEAVAREEGYTGDMKALSQVEAKAIYRSRFWTKTGFYLLEPISASIAQEVFDTGVNMGPGVPSLWLQRALNVLNRQGADYPDINADGSVGPGTAAALAALIKVRGRVGETAVLRLLNCFQGVRYVELAERNSAEEKFELGWVANRIQIPN